MTDSTKPNGDTGTSVQKERAAVILPDGYALGEKKTSRSRDLLIRILSAAVLILGFYLLISGQIRDAAMQAMDLRINLYKMLAGLLLLLGLLGFHARRM